MPKDIVAQVAYDGVALAEGSMDVRDFAPALLALGDVVQEATRLLNGDRARISVHVESRFEKGSFGLTLGLILTAYQHVAGFFGPHPIKSAKDIAEYIGLITGTKPSLFALLKMLKGTTPPTATTLSNGDVHIHVEVSGNSNDVIVSPAVYQLAQSVRVRRFTHDALKPLEEPGIDSFKVKDGERVIERIGKEDLPAFETPSMEVVDAAATSERPALLEVLKPSFSPELKWVFSDGAGGKINAYVKDRDFIENVQSGQRAFAKSL